MKTYVTPVTLARNFVILLLVGLLFVVSQAFADDGVATATPAWTQPPAIALQKIGDTPEDSDSSGIEENMNCFKESRKLTGTDSYVSGCFMPTAFGSLDVRNGYIQYAGSGDGVVPLRPHGANEAVLGWPYTSIGVALVDTHSEGSYLGLYRNLVGAAQDVKDGFGQLKAKQLTDGPTEFLTDGAGKKLIVNANSMAFSYYGYWLVVETYNGSFVRINLATQVVTPITGSFVTASGSGFNASQLTISDDGRYVAIANNSVGSFRVYDLANCAPSGSAQPNCTSYNYWPHLTTRFDGIKYAAHLRFLRDDVLSVRIADKKGAGIYELSPAASIQSLTNYLALGDSYVSGEGAYSYKTGTNTGDSSCHLSGNSYPVLLSHELYAPIGGNSVACSGATTSDIIPSNIGQYLGQNRGGVARSKRPDSSVNDILTLFKPGNIGQIEFASKYQPQVISIGIGGNDIGFATIIEQCVAPKLRPSKNIIGNNTCYSTYEDRLELARLIDTQLTKLTRLFQTIQGRSPHSRVYVVGYPQIAVNSTKCGVNVQLNASEVTLSQELVQQLNEVISEAAKKAGVQYVDISRALDGHRLCETTDVTTAVNGITAGTSTGISTQVAGLPLRVAFLGKESYHPNILGQRLIKEAILGKTNNFTKVMPTKSNAYLPATTAATLLDAPKSGRAVTNISFNDSIISNNTVIAGTQLDVRVDGTAAGFVANTNYLITVANNQFNVRSDSETNITANINIDSSITTGGQTVTVVGPNQLNQTSTIITTIYVLSSVIDFDGDGISNEIDSCKYIPNSGLDSDNDGIDDACDLLNDAGSSTNPPIVTPPIGGLTTPPTPAPAAGSNNTGNITSPVQQPNAANPQTTRASSTPEVAASLNNPVAVSTPAYRLGARLTVAPVSSSALAKNGIAIKSQQLSDDFRSTNQVLSANTANSQVGATRQHSSGRSALHYQALRVIAWQYWAVIVGLMIIAFFSVDARYQAKRQSYEANYVKNHRAELLSTRSKSNKKIW